MNNIESANEKLSDAKIVLSYFYYSPELEEYDQDVYKQLCKQLSEASVLQFKAEEGSEQDIKKYVDFVNRLDKRLKKWLEHEPVNVEKDGLTFV